MFSLKSALRRKLGLSVPKSDQRFLDDPYLRLGYGMHSYLHFMLQLMVMMCWIMILSVPLMVFYATYSDLDVPGLDYAFNKYSLGNMGASESLCHVKPVTSPFPTKLKCSSGLISLDTVCDKTGEPIFDVGIIPKSTHVKTYCSNSAFDDPANCSSFINKPHLQRKVEELCVGRPDCMLGSLDKFIVLPEAFDTFSLF